MNIFVFALSIPIISAAQVARISDVQEQNT